MVQHGAGDEVIMSIAGHVSRATLSRYSHGRMEAKRRALDEIAARQRAADEPGGNPAAADCGYFRTSTGSISAGRFTGQQPEVNSVYQGVSIPRHVRLQAFLQLDTWRVNSRTSADG